MISRNIINIVVSLTALLLIILIAFKYCGKQSAYSKELFEAEQAASKKAYNDTLNFIRGQSESHQEKAEAQEVRVVELEKQIDSLISKHEVTKKKVKPSANWPTADSNHAMLVPNEYVDECEMCFNKLKAYKEENIQLRFERDSYDTLMRTQSEIQEKRILEIQREKAKLNKRMNDCSLKLDGKCENTRKLKLSGAGMFNNMLLPRAGGLGLIYEDKQFNEFGGHILFSSGGEIYMLHIAKTISLRRKR